MNPQHWSALRLPSRAHVASVLQETFPEGTEQRNYVVRELAAATAWVFLYIQAIEGVTENRLRPSMVRSMGNSQAARVSLEEREQWRRGTSGNRVLDAPDRWYGADTREPIRDETINALVRHGAIREDAELPPQSPRPRYWLAASFAALFDPDLTPEALSTAIAAWQSEHLTAGARARIALVRGFSIEQGQVQVEFPNVGMRIFPAGPSSHLLKATIEGLLPSSFEKPVVLAVAEGRSRITHEDRQTLTALGLEPDPRLMPDVLAADLGDGTPLTLITIELVATDGPMNPRRLAQVSQWLISKGHGDTRLVAGTVFSDRNSAAARRLVPETAWGTFVWFAAEPDFILVKLDAGPDSLANIVTTPNRLVVGA